MIFDDDFKKEIALLPDKEKTKLLLRLLKKDLILAKRLDFELVSGDTPQMRRTIMEQSITKQIHNKEKLKPTPKNILRLLRSISSEITIHRKVTKDKVGEASLNLLMINEALEVHSSVLLKSRINLVYKLYIYIIVRTYKILTLIHALHEDFYIEFEDELNRLNQLYKQNKDLEELAKRAGLKLNWINHEEIPDNIADIHKKMREAEFLK